MLSIINVKVNVRIHSLKRLNDYEINKDVLFSVRLASATIRRPFGASPASSFRHRRDEEAVPRRPNVALWFSRGGRQRMTSSRRSYDIISWGHIEREPVKYCFHPKKINSYFRVCVFIFWAKNGERGGVSG